MSENAAFDVHGGHKLNGDTRRNLIQNYRLEERGGRVFWIEAHKRPTAMILEGRYQKKTDTEANVWSGHYVAVWTDNIEVVRDIEKTIPSEERLAEIRSLRQ